MSDQKPEFLQDALDLASQVLSPKAYANLWTTLKKFILLRFTFRGSAKTKVEDYPKKILLKDFIADAPSYFEEAHNQALEAGKNPGTLANNRSVFNKFLDVMLSQSWYAEVVKTQPLPKRAPKRIPGTSLNKIRKGRRQHGAKPYGLKEEELTPKLNQQIEDLHNYLTTLHVSDQGENVPIRDRSWQGYRVQLLLFLGWLKNVSEFALDELDLTAMADKLMLKDYLQWHLSTRGNGRGHAVHVCMTALNVAKWHYGKHSQRRNFQDCTPVLDIRYIAANLSKRMKNDRRTTSVQALSEKLLEFEECHAVVEHLRSCCAERGSNGKKRSTRAIIDSWQKYLIIAILVYTAVRQLEIRELELNGQNLKRAPDGWWVFLLPGKHKTGSKTGEPRAYPLFTGPLKEQLTKDLDTYVNQIRPLASLKHDYLFFLHGSSRYPESRGKRILNANHLAILVPTVMTRASAQVYGVSNMKSPSPHDFRRIFCNWLYTYGTAQEQELFAELMGHSVEEARRTYAMVKSHVITCRADTAYESVAKRERQLKATLVKEISR